MIRSNTPPTWMQNTISIFLILAAFPSSTLAEGAKSVDAQPETVSNEDNRRILKITWKEIVSLVDNHPKIAVGEDKTRAAKAAADAARAVPNPSIEASTAYSMARDSSASRLEWGLTLSIPLDWIGKRGPKIAAAEADVRVVDAELKELRMEVLLELRLLFWNLVYEQERVAALIALDSETMALAETVRQRVQKGESRPVEATRVEIEAEKIAGELAMAESNLKTQSSRLGLWLGVGSDKQLVAVADLETLPRSISSAAAHSKVRKTHPAIVAAEARIDVRSKNLSLERRARVPGVNFQAFTDHELDRTAYGVGVALELPLWNWNSGNIRLAEALLAAGKNQLDADRIEIVSVVIEAESACHAGVGLAIRYRDQILPRATKVARTIERTYELGEAPLLDVIDARRTLLQTRKQFLAALVQAQTACSRLAILAGEELP